MLPDFILDAINEKLFQANKDQPYSDEADNLGYGSQHIVQNSGSIGIFVVLLAAQQLLASVTTRVTKKGGKANKWATNKKSSFRWAGFTNFLNEVYLNMAFAVCINAAAFGVSSTTTTLMTIISTIVGLTQICWPIVVACGMDKTMKVAMPLVPFSDP